MGRWVHGDGRRPGGPGGETRAPATWRCACCSTAVPTLRSPVPGLLRPVAAKVCARAPAAKVCLRTLLWTRPRTLEVLGRRRTVSGGRPGGRHKPSRSVRERSEPRTEPTPPSETPSIRSARGLSGHPSSGAPRPAHHHCATAWHPDPPPRGGPGGSRGGRSRAKRSGPRPAERARESGASLGPRGVSGGQPPGLRTWQDLTRSASTSKKTHRGPHRPLRGHLPLRGGGLRAARYHRVPFARKALPEVRPAGRNP